MKRLVSSSPLFDFHATQKEGSMTAVIEKVTGYVTRRSASGMPELLVFLPQPRTVGVPGPGRHRGAG
jgi:hypothetical protein